MSVLYPKIGFASTVFVASIALLIGGKEDVSETWKLIICGVIGACLLFLCSAAITIIRLEIQETVESLINKINKSG